jgi:membrane protein implicated in regulation of membrane protease activity
VRTLARYVAFQVPGWFAAALLLWAGVEWLEVFPAAVGLGLFALFLLKDAALYPLVRHSYERRRPLGGEELVGARGVVQRDLSPSGWVRVGAELWRAQLAPGHESAAAGVGVRVRAVRDLTLLVEPEDVRGGPRPGPGPGG